MSLESLKAAVLSAMETSSKTLLKNQPEKIRSFYIFETDLFLDSDPKSKESVLVFAVAKRSLKRKPLANLFAKHVRKEEGYTKDAQGCLRGFLRPSGGYAAGTCSVREGVITCEVSELKGIGKTADKARFLSQLYKRIKPLKQWCPRGTLAFQVAGNADELEAQAVQAEGQVDQEESRIEQLLFDNGLLVADQDELLGATRGLLARFAESEATSARQIEQVSDLLETLGEVADTSTSAIQSVVGLVGRLAARSALGALSGADDALSALRSALNERITADLRKDMEQVGRRIVELKSLAETETKESVQQLGAQWLAELNLRKNQLRNLKQQYDAYNA